MPTSVDRDQAVLALGDVEAGEQHRRLADGIGMHALSSEHEHEDPRQPEVADDVGREADQRVRDGRERKQDSEHEPSEGSDYPAAGCRRPPPCARLGRPDEQPARPRDAAGRRGAARARRRGRGHGARLRADGRAVRALRARRRGRSAATAAGASRRRRSGSRPGRRRSRAGPRRAAARGPLRPRARPRLERRHRRGGAAAHPELDDVRLRVGDRAAHGQLPARAGGRRARGDPAGAPGPLRRARGKLQRYPGLKEEYYLADFEPDTAVLDELGLDATQPIAVVRTPPEVSLYHRFENALFARRARPPARAGARSSCCPRTPEQRAELGRAGGLHRPRARDRRAVAHRLRRPRGDARAGR